MVIATVQKIFASDSRNVTFWRIQDRKFIESATKESVVFRDRYFCIHYCMTVDYCNSIAWNAKTGNCQTSAFGTSHDHMIRRKMSYDPDWTGYARLKYSGMYHRTHFRAYGNVLCNIDSCPDDKG